MQPSDCNPLTIKSVSRDESGRRKRDGVCEIAAKINARFVTDLEPGIVMVALMEDEASLPINGAAQFVIALILPAFKIYFPAINSH